MKTLSLLRLLLALLLSSVAAIADTVNVTFNAATDVPVTAVGYTAAGNSINFTLNFVPAVSELMVVKNTGADFIHGTFSNLGHGQAVALSYAGQTYNFVANYYGGSGNDFVLVWAGTRVFAWGLNDAGQIGDNTQFNRRTPVAVNTTAGVSALFGKTVLSAVTGVSHCLAVCSDGTLAAWGYNYSGELGDNTTIWPRKVPVMVNTTAGVSALFGKTVVAAAGGGTHSLAVCSDGSLAAWGRNTDGQLGDNTVVDRHAPVAVNTTTGVSALFGKTVVAAEAGPYHSLALCSDGTVVAWGNNYWGQLGDNTVVNRLAPVAVNTTEGVSALFGKTVTAITVGIGHSLALCSDGTVVAWGSGFLGDNTTTQRNVPVAVNTTAGVSALFGKIVAAITSYQGHSLALCSDGTVVAWGDNQFGQLGDNTTVDRHAPVAVNRTAGVSALFGKTVTAIAAGLSFSLARCSDGTVVGWGRNSSGELGNNTTTTRWVPVTVNRSALSATEQFSHLSGAQEHALALVVSTVQPPGATFANAGVTGLTLTSARLNGTVNVQNYQTVVAFEYGTDGTTFPNQIPAVPGIVSGFADIAVYATVTGLQKGTQYYYRLKATNQGGPTFSDTWSFITRTEPTASLGAISVLSTNSAQVTGTANAHGSDTQVFIDYSTDPANLLNSVPVTPAVATGYADTAVSAVLGNLPQGTTYYYRIRGTSMAGVGWSATGSFQLATLSGLTQVFPAASPEAEGFVIITVMPAGIGGGWRFAGEQQWRAPGVPAGGLTTGDRVVEFRPVPGWIQPPPETVSVVSGEAAAVFEGSYFTAATAGTGGLSVELKPDSIAAAGVPEAQRAQWRLPGEAAWRDSGETMTGLPAGSYLVECKPVAGRSTPATAAVAVEDGQTRIVTLTYFLADAQTGTPPAVLAFETASTTAPYAWTGQIRSDAGLSSGFVVKPRVVATAAHVVWNDGTLSAATGLQWLFQRDRGTYEPKPQIPRGFYMFDGYAAQRTAENSPGTSSPQSQNLDVAAMYFDEDAGRGGSSGWLASDAVSNEFLLSSAQKTLVGYPVNGISAASQGRMHATPAANVPFSQGFGRTYITSAIRSSGGGSGGPLCVQFEGGSWYPAAVYLGGSAQTVVRAIDSTVIDLFNRAEVSGNGGGNNTGGGITHTGVTTTGSSTQPGAIKVLIEPEAARTAGARWNLSPYTPSRLHNAQLGNLSTAAPSYVRDYVLVLNAVAGFQVPTSPTVQIRGGQLLTATFTYAPDQTPLDAWRLANFGTAANTGNAADSADPDRDGRTNMDEYIAVTNPNSGASAFTAISVTDAAGLHIRFTAKAGRRYRLESNSAPTGAWQTLQTRAATTSDAEVDWLVSPVPQTRRFCRVVAEIP